MHKLAMEFPRRIAAATILAAVLGLAAGAARAKSESIVIDAFSGQVLYSFNADEARFPASLTKVMTLYLVFEALRDGAIKPNEKLRVSRRASRQRPSRLGLRKGRTITVSQAVMALITKSANDAAVVLAEKLGGSEAEFARLMTKKARELGMQNTVFRNASGLHDPHQVTTARDMARLAMALIRDFPVEYRKFATKEFRYRGRRYKNHNPLLGVYEGADGMKTGYIRQSGYNLMSSAGRGGHRLIGIVLGARSPKMREWRMKALLDYGFERLGGEDRLRVARSLPLKLDEPNGAALASNMDTGMAAAPRKSSRPTTAISATHAPPPASPQWGIQVGAYDRAAPAEKAAKRVADRYPALLGNARLAIIPVERNGERFYRARLLGLTEDRARRACKQLKQHRMPCLAVLSRG
jgi:D-alanyl-D-alanine carboxypeptidase